MGENSWSLAPTVTLPNLEREEHWRHFDDSVNAVSFGFVATAILISMFLVMAIFERFLRPSSTDLMASDRRIQRDLESQRTLSGKVDNPSPKMSIYARGVSVLMPGQDIPTYIAHPVPVPAPCPPERISWPLHQHNTIGNSTSNSS